MEERSGSSKEWLYFIAIGWWIRFASDDLLRLAEQTLEQLVKVLERHVRRDQLHTLRARTMVHNNSFTSVSQSITTSISISHSN